MSGMRAMCGIKQFNTDSNVGQVTYVMNGAFVQDALPAYTSAHSIRYRIYCGRIDIFAEVDMRK